METVIPKSGKYSVCCHPGWGSGVFVQGETLPNYAKTVSGSRTAQRVGGGRFASRAEPQRLVDVLHVTGRLLPRRAGLAGLQQHVQGGSGGERKHVLGLRP